MALGSIANALNPKMYTTIGILENLIEYLQMLECIYPDLFFGITKLYETEKVKIRISSYTDLFTPAMKIILNETCSDTNNAYQMAYNIIKQIFKYRFDYMMQNKGLCCRVPTSINF